MKTGLIKKPKDFTNFTVVPNPILRDKNLSVGAVGLYCFLFSHTAEFTITIEFIIGAFKDGKAAIKSKIKELETAGYLLRERVKGDKGLFVGYNYELVLEPADQLSDNGLSGRTVYVQPENRPHTNRLQSNTNNNTNINTEITKEINTKDTAQVKKPAPAKFSQLVENAFAPYLDLFKGEKTLPKNDSQKMTWKNTLAWFEKNDYDLREVYAAVKWARQDPFWGPNVLSLPALKTARNGIRKIDNLMAKYKVAIKQDNKPKAMAYLKGVKEWFLKTNALGKVEVQAQTYNGDVINEFLIRQNVQFTDQDITDIYNYLKND